MDRKDKIEAVIQQRREGLVILEDIHDPHNAEAVMRTVEAMGWQKVWLIFEKEVGFDPKQVGKSSSSSANKWLRFEIFGSTKECLEKAKKEGYVVYATVLDSEADSLAESDLTKRKIAWCVGNEHRGLSQMAINMADKKVYIPMKGMVQSLNLSVATAICLWETERQRGKKRGYEIDDGEREKLRREWK